MAFKGTIPAVIVDTKDGDFLVDQVKFNAQIKISFPQEGGVIIVPASTGGLSSTFSSYGLTVSHQIFLRYLGH